MTTTSKELAAKADEWSTQLERLTMAVVKARDEVQAAEQEYARLESEWPDLLADVVLGDATTKEATAHRDAMAEQKRRAIETDQAFAVLRKRQQEATGKRGEYMRAVRETQQQEGHDPYAHLMGRG